MTLKKQYYRIDKTDTIVPNLSQGIGHIPLMRENTILLKAVGLTVEKFRKQRGMTKTALADFSVLQDCYIRGIIKGKRNPTIVVLYALCEALQVSPQEFFKEIEETYTRELKGRKDGV